MPAPFEKPAAPSNDVVVAALEKGSRARQLLQLGVGSDLDRRRAAIWHAAEQELRGGTLSPERAFMHVACSNALRRYKEELNEDVTSAQKAAELLHTETEDGDTWALPEGD